MADRKRTFELLQERRAERMRQGQAVCEIVTLPSDDEIRLALVPLTDAEFQNSLLKAAEANIAPEVPSTHEVFYRDRVQKCAILFASAREVDDLSVPFFDTLEEVFKMDFTDVSEVFSHYEQMVAFSSPSLDGLSEEEMDEIKKALLEVSWSDLSGASWYAAKRFLSTLSAKQPQVNLSGSLPTWNSTMPSEDQESISSA